ncbi:succinate dehydrogenase, cytochrome b556 subunit [Antarcticirhabdus aurantiaca]|uniref:Succinate dehydrogenase, cytochrome b556 subunit n=1 Tax=Antarcticirhabdus aurantiaca TaxID=2606717 RepID=A0ACD4NKI4_9HYPH|nr:succinate dehydrogenase, cytochrome b556 subunit [Antarcticirhabdus aurantiaca]WAJ27354.1 succinate dehydrogenase, cytochrome b556 subunit [Jeongeuplla avenae]
MSDTKSARPLSPHLSIYRFKPTMAMSIVHRVTGVGLYLGTVFFVWWLLAAASGPEAFSYASAFFGSIIGRLFLFVYSWVLLHHMFGGLRHFVWDMGHAITREQSTLAAQATLVASLASTLLLWLIVWIV